MSVPGTAEPDLPKPLHGPAFGSYDRDDVAWLLTDLSNAELEAPTEQREDAVQSGRAHYAASLPVEYQPSAGYQQLFQDELASSASQLARAVGVVTELLLAARGTNLVLVSLARAGTPVGALIRRWARFVYGLDVPHYSCSIVRGQGIDMVALEYLAAHHEPADITFVDGWTGKGAITRELADAVAKGNAHLGLASGNRFAPSLAVLADPGCCVETYGTRDDLLVPSACLNSTVSGLVSRTVLNHDLIGPRQFHGAKFYPHLADVDVSRQFLDAITAKFAAVAELVAHDWPALQSEDRSPTWAGWRAAEAISRQFGIGDVNLVKPGVGETTRVLLRRVPWKVLVRADAGQDLRHIHMLAEQRSVPVEIVPSLPYRCVGLIRPRGRLGASATKGRHGSA